MTKDFQAHTKDALGYSPCRASWRHPIEPPTPTKQTTFASLTFDTEEKRVRREMLLAEMDQVIPWPMLEAIIEPHYPKAGRRGRPRMPLSTMLRIHFMHSGPP